MTQPALFADSHGRPRTQPATPNQQPMPAWLRRQLEAAGHIDPTTGATRTARMSFCPSCRRGVIRGIDATVCGQSRDCDPTPLTALEEAVSLLAGRRTFGLRWQGRYELDHRDQWQIHGTPARSKPDYDVLVEHDCVLAAGMPDGYRPLTAGPPIVETADNLPEKAPF